MNIRKELLKQQKKALIYVVSAVIGTMTLTGCGSDQFDYQYEEDGTVTVEGTISYEKLKKLKFVHLTNEIALIDDYILVYEYTEYIDRYAARLCYKNYETGRKIYGENEEDFKNFKIEIVVDHMIDFLYKYNMVKDEYSIDDVKKLKELLLQEEQLFKDNLETSSVKVLSKKKIKS